MMKKILQKRISSLNQKKSRNGEFILYWMQANHRVENNWALTYAIELAN